MDTDADQGMNLAALLAWIEDHRTALMDSPDMVALAQTAARKMDSDGWTAQDLTAYRLTLQALREIGSGDDDGQTELDARLRTPLRDQKGSKS